jgi:hypothetical protein
MNNRLVKCVVSGVLAGATLLFAACSSSDGPAHPRIYRGGQYYGDAVHQ